MTVISDTTAGIEPAGDTELAGDATFSFPPLLAAGPLAATDSNELCATVIARVSDVARHRGFPMHTAVVFNTLHWGFDFVDGFYSAPAVLDVLAAAIAETGMVRPGERVRALPVGGFTQLTVGNSNEIWAEIIAKDGRTSSGGNGVIDRTAVGGPSDDNVNEAWLLEPADNQSRWVRTLADWTDAGHLERNGLVPLTAIYDNGAAANDDDIAYFVRWMVDHASAALAAGPLGSSLEERPDPATRSGRERLTGALAATCAAIDAILADSDEFVRWGDYWLLAEWVSDIDDRPHQAFHRNDLQSVLGQLARCGAPGTGWATLGPRLADIADRFDETSRQRGGTNRRIDSRHDDIARPYYGKNWLMVTAASSRWLADTADVGHGVVSAAGQRRYLRVDDRWPWGGAWMSSPPPGPDSVLWSWPIDDPLWLGRQGLEDFTELWALDVPEADQHADTDDAPEAGEQTTDDAPEAGEQTTDDANDEPADVEQDDPLAANAATADADEQPAPVTRDPADEPTLADPALDDPAAMEAAPAEPTPLPEPHQEPTPKPDDQIADTFIDTTVVLRATDIDNGTLKLPDRFAWFIERLRHDGAIFLHLNHDGDIDDDQTNQQLNQLIGDETVGPVSWPVDFFAGIHIHLAGIPGLPTIYASSRLADDGSGFIGDIPDWAQPTGRQVTLAGLAVDALRRVGRASYGSRRATGMQIATAMFGTDCPAVLCAAVIETLETLHAAGKLARPGTEYSITDTAPDPTRTRFVPAGRASMPPELRDVRAHIVTGFLRRLPYGHQASTHKEAQYLAEYGHPLPNGWTYVDEFVRGEHTTAYRAAFAGIRTDTGAVLTSDDIDDLISHVFRRRTP